MKRRNFLLIIVSVFILNTFCGCGLKQAQEQAPASSEVENSGEPEAYDDVGNEALETEAESIITREEKLVRKMGRGINIGNSLDCFDEWNEGALVTETSWGNPEITENYVKMLVDQGFKTIRIPVTWVHHIHDGKIDEDFLARVKAVVDYAYNSGAYVIIDIHHEKKFYPSNDNYETSKEYLEMIWYQVSEAFKDYDERLIFEGINEPRFYGTSDEWTEGTDEGADIVNKLMADFVNVVRNTGGNNLTRTLLITCYCNRTGGRALDKMVIPDDDNLAISVHSYDPYDFTASDYPREFDESLKQSLNYTVNTLKDFKNTRNIPVIITEWGAYESVGKSGRLEYIEYFQKAFDEADIPCIWWDNGKCYGKEGYGLFDRYNERTVDQDIVNAILKEN